MENGIFKPTWWNVNKLDREKMAEILWVVEKGYGRINPDNHKQ